MSWTTVKDQLRHLPEAQQLAEKIRTSREFAKIQKFDRNGDPITLEEWADLLSDRDYSTVGADYVTIDGGRVLVNTLWTGVPWYGDDLFTSRLLPMRGCVDESGQQRPVWAQSYSTLAAAAGGHAEILDRLRAGRWPT
ncbi:hypothetical protein ACKAMS_22585 [Rhodococcus sp. 5A-K4]|uniref:hypothetical protein n=1 Tax=Rhodococcus sp. 5A-K4 TaxID=3384442 RepID=UPI0038D3FBF0